MPEVAKLIGSLLACRSAKVLIGDCCAITNARGSVVALPIQDILVRSNFMPGSPDELVVDEAGVEGADGQAIGARGIDRVGADEMPGARKVPHHEGRARQVALHVFCDQPSIEVVAAAGRGRDDVGDGLALEEVRAALRLRRRRRWTPRSGRRRATGTLRSLMQPSDMAYLQVESPASGKRSR